MTTRPRSAPSVHRKYAEAAVAAYAARPLPQAVEDRWRSPSRGDDAEPEAPVPHILLLGLLGGERSTAALPSHAGESMPRRFDTPVAGSARRALVHRAAPARQRPNSAKPATAHWRPASAAPSASLAQGANATLAPGPAEPQCEPPSHPAHSAPAHAAAAADEDDGASGGGGADVVGGGFGSRPGRRGGANSRRSIHTLDRVMQKELARRNLGFPRGHLPPPSAAMPPTYLSSLQRGRSKAALRDMTMIPSTLRAWESTVERSLNVARPYSGVVSYQRNALAPRPAATPARPASPPAATAAAARAAAAAAGPPPGEVPGLTPYEMRRFLQHSQRYFLSVPPKPFGLPADASIGAPAAGGGGTAGPAPSRQPSRVPSAKAARPLGRSAMPISVSVTCGGGGAGPSPP